VLQGWYGQNSLIILRHRLREHIKSTSDYLGTPNYYGSGRVNAYTAVRTLRVPEYYSTLQAALNAVVHNDEIISVTSGTHTINSAMTIPAGVKLQLKSGVTVNFNSGLTVNGSLSTSGGTLNFGNGTGLVVNGTASCQSTTFTGNYIFGWSGISINSSLSTSHTFYSCEISNAEIGISAYNTNTIISSTRIHDIIRYNHNINGYAVNFLNGVTGDVYPSNVFYGNDWDIRSDATSKPNVSGSFAGNNSFRKPAGYMQISNGNPQYTIPARGNYWQIGPITQGNVDVSGQLNYDPNPARSPQDDHRAEVESELFLRKATVKNDKPIEKLPGVEELNKTISLFFDKKYDEALPIMHNLVKEYQGSYVGKSALVFIEHILAETGRAEEIISMLNSYSIGESKLAQFAHYRTGYQYLYKREYDKAIEIMKGTEFSKEDADLRQARLYDLGIIHHDILNKKAEATDYFSELVNTYPECPLAEVTEVFYKVRKYNYEKPTTKDETTITETKLFENYPNPFNPSTVIRYQLSEASQVSLKIYDVMGREVTTLVNSFQNKGSYDVTFNAQSLSSGIYFYKLNANAKQLINKMLLMK
jgi:tetratricopeptide (TPR) repeat protein